MLYQVWMERRMFHEEEMIKAYARRKSATHVLLFRNAVARIDRHGRLSCSSDISEVKFREIYSSVKIEGFRKVYEKERKKEKIERARGDHVQKKVGKTRH